MEGRPCSGDQSVCQPWRQTAAFSWTGNQDVGLGHQGGLQGECRIESADFANMLQVTIFTCHHLKVKCSEVSVTTETWMLLTLFIFPLQKFTGHSTAVTTLRFATTRPPDSNGLYFLSGAAHDRLLSVWWVLTLSCWRCQISPCHV